MATTTKVKASISSRVEGLRRLLLAQETDAFLVTHLPHLRYLSGFSGSSGIGLVTRRGAWLLTDGRYAQQVRSEVRGWNVVITLGDLVAELKKRRLVRGAGASVGIDGNSMLLGQYRLLKKTFPDTRFLPKVDVVEQLAAVKDAAEIASIKRAVEITDRVFLELLGVIAPGISEIDLAAEISYRQRKHGAESDAFETIVASGERGALPHGRATAKKLRNREFVTLDFGCVVDGYHSDLTRTVALGRIAQEKKNVYMTVLDAQQRAIDAVREGMDTRALDEVARSHIRSRGYEKFFRHSLGHGLGLQIHEAPRISFASKGSLRSGNVITIEPGIYIPHLGGVRIEDDVLVRNGGCEVLTRSPKELIVL